MSASFALMRVLKRIDAQSQRKSGEGVFFWISIPSSEQYVRPERSSNAATICSLAGFRAMFEVPHSSACLRRNACRSWQFRAPGSDKNLQHPPHTSRRAR